MLTLFTRRPLIAPDYINLTPILPISPLYTTTQHIQLPIMGRIQTSFHHRYQQGSLLRMWQKADILEIQASEINPIRQHFPSLYAASVSAIPKLKPIVLGYFLSVMKKCANRTAILQLQTEDPDLMSAWCYKMKKFILASCPSIDLLDIDLLELGALLDLWMEERCANDPHAAIRRIALLPIFNGESILRADMFHQRIVERFFQSWMVALMPVFHQHLSFTQFVRVTQGFWLGERGHGKLPNLEVPIVERMQIVEFPEVTYRPTGDRVDLTDFCQRAQTVPADSTCSICASDINIDAEDPNKKPVVTACNHYFHETCMDTWVNESAILYANACPFCRTEMCEGRERVPIPPLGPTVSVSHRLYDGETVFDEGEDPSLEDPSLEEQLGNTLNTFNVLLQALVREASVSGITV
jgi:hypothetical protein